MDPNSDKMADEKLMGMEELIKDVFNTNFPAQFELASTFLRFQEYYESPEFRGKIFALEEFKKWYIANSPKGKETGEFTYYEDWSGFNVPSYTLEPFYDGKFDPLTNKEQNLLDSFKGRREKRFYIIGTCGKEKNSLKHEMAHGLFYTNPEYKKEVLEVLKTVDQSVIKSIENFFSASRGYHPDVWIDETHAYLVTDLYSLEKMGIDTKKLKKANRKLNRIFYKHYIPQRTKRKVEAGWLRILRYARKMGSSEKKGDCGTDGRFLGAVGTNIFGGFLVLGIMDNNYMGAAVSGICLTNSVAELVTGKPHWMYEYAGKRMIAGYRSIRKMFAHHLYEGK